VSYSFQFFLISTAYSASHCVSPLSFSSSLFRLEINEVKKGEGYLSVLPYFDLARISFKYSNNSFQFFLISTYCNFSLNLFHLTFSSSLFRLISFNTVFAISSFSSSLFRRNKNNPRKVRHTFQFFLISTKVYSSPNHRIPSFSSSLFRRLFTCNIINNFIFQFFLISTGQHRVERGILALSVLPYFDTC